MEVQTLGKRRQPVAEEEEEEEKEEEEIQKLQHEVEEMGRRILDARRTIPDRLLQALSSRLIAQRPNLSSQTLADVVPSVDGSLLASADQRMHETLQVLKAKAESNISALPVVLKRTSNCILRMEKLGNCDVKPHYVFNRKGR